MKNNYLGSTIYDCGIVHLPKISTEAGNITSINNHLDLPFAIKRIYYLYDIPGGESRGGHAHKGLYQVITALGGSFDILLDDGIQKRVLSMNRPDMGLLIVPGIWREIFNFSSGCTCFVLASEKYSEEDYIRDYDSFKIEKANEKR